MSKYLELGKLAEESSEAFHKRHQEAQAQARFFVRNYVVYLEAPASTVHFVRLDNALETTAEKTELRSKVPLVYARPGWWHFAFSIKFAHVEGGSFVTETNKMAVKVHASGKLTFQHDGKEFDADPQNPDSYAPLHAHMYQDSINGMTKHFGEPSAKIGFLNTND